MKVFSMVKKETALVILLIAVSFFMFFYNIGAPSFFETDEVIYSQIAREIVRTGDWVTLHFHGQNWFIHPPMYMWLVSLSSLVFGENEFNSRLWCGLFGVALVFMTYLLGKKMFRDGVGILAGFILASSLQMMMQARLAIFDVPLAFFIILSVYFFLCWQKDRDEKYYYLSFLAMGLGTLMKGPISFLLPMIVLTPYLYFIKDLKALINIKIVFGILLYLIVGGSWYIAEYVLHGRAFFDKVVGYYLINRYTGIVESHTGPWFYYFGVLLIGFLPWSIFLPFSFVYQAKRTGDENNLLMVLWMGIGFVFFSLAGTKLPGYVLSLYPVIAISVGKLLADFNAGEEPDFERNVELAYKSLAVFSIFIIILGIIPAMMEAPASIRVLFLDLNIMLLILGAGGIISAIAFFRSEASYNSVIALVIATMVFTVYTYSYTMRHLEEFKPMRTISRQILRDIKPGDRIIGYKTTYNSSYIFYLDKPVVFTENEAQLAKQINGKGRLFLIAEKKAYDKVRNSLTQVFYAKYKFGDIILLTNFKK